MEDHSLKIVIKKLQEKAPNIDVELLSVKTLYTKTGKVSELNSSNVFYLHNVICE